MPEQVRPLGFKFPQEVPPVLFALAQHLVGVVQDGAGQAQPGRDGEGAALAGLAHQQAVGGGEARLVELHRGVLEAGVAQGPLADLAEVGGTEDPAVAARQGLEQGDAQGGAFLGVGAGAELVQQDHAAVMNRFEDLFQMQNMAAEGREASRDGLVVADVRVEAGQGRKGRALPGRHGATTGGQGRQQPHRQQQWLHLALEEARHPVALGRRALGMVDDEDALLLQRGRQLVVEDGVFLVDQRVGLLGHGAQVVTLGVGGGARAVHRQAHGPDGIGKPHLEEFVHVGRDDGDVAQPLEQRHVGAAGLGQHAPVEGQDGPLAVEQGR